MAKYYFVKEGVKLDADVFIGFDNATRLLDWCAENVKGFKFMEFYEDFMKANKGGYDREKFIVMLKEWRVFVDGRKSSAKIMHRFLLENRGLFELVQRNKLFDLEPLSMWGLVNLGELLDVLLLRYDDHRYLNERVLFEMCVGVMWYGFNSFEESYEKVKYGKKLKRKW